MRKITCVLLDYCPTLLNIVLKSGQNNMHLEKRAVKYWRVNRKHILLINRCHFGNSYTPSYAR